MASYKYGSSGTGVEELQKKLNEKGNYNLEVDGSYGPKTQEAVTDYQRKNNLTVDGKAGPETLGHINGSISNAVSQPIAPANTQKQNVNTVQPSVQQTVKERLSVLQKGYSSSTDEALDMLYDKVVNQKPFEYDVMGDPAYNQYAQTFRRNAALMSEDAMAQAAQLTGGYGSSYGQAVGTQAYNEQMSKLNDIVPELRENAYAKYNDERAKALENLALLLNERDYDRSILESDRAFAEQQRQFDAGVALDKEQLAFQKYQYENEIKREDAIRDQERDAAAIEMGFSSWDEYVKAVQTGKYIPKSNDAYDNLTLSEIQKASDIFKNDGYSGLEKYISQLEQTGKSYSDEQFYSLIFGATGLENVDTYDDAISWISTKSSPNMNENRTRSPLGEEDQRYDEDSVAFGGYPGAAFLAGSRLSESTKSNIATAKNIVKTESEWKKNPSYGSYPEYLRYTLLDIISE
ncbi:MAG: peptidoglycan-binding protein [Clostridia bacterium]|nr:peptidoglycan-binding protein [Clostridia bacterium]